MVDDFLTPVEESLERLRALLHQQELNFVDVPGLSLVRGVALAWSGGGFLTLSIGAGSPHTLLITAGILKDVERDTLGVLEACNYRNQSNAAYPFFLHDAEVGWDVLLQQSFPLQLLLDVPPFMNACLEPTTVVAAEAREEFLDKGMGGTAYVWGEEDAARLLMRMKNRDALELSASFTYPHLLVEDILVGVWVGHDYDEAICAGPVVLSRSRRTAGKLAGLVRNARLLSVGEHRATPPVRATSATS